MTTTIPKPSGESIPAAEKQREDDAAGRGAERQLDIAEDAALSGHDAPEIAVDEAASPVRDTAITGVPPA